jgi:hypothetical protein
MRSVVGRLGGRRYVPRYASIMLLALASADGLQDRNFVRGIAEKVKGYFYGQKSNRERQVLGIGEQSEFD